MGFVGQGTAPGGPESLIQERTTCPTCTDLKPDDPHAAKNETLRNILEFPIGKSHDTQNTKTKDQPINLNRTEEAHI